MAEVTMDKGLQGGISNMTPSSLISRLVEDADVDYGVPVKQGSDDKGCKAGITTTDFVGITVAQSGSDGFAEGTEARIMTQGVVWVTAAGKVTAGDPVSYDSGWKTGGTSKPQLTDARYETGGVSGDLVQIRLWGTGVESSS